MSTYESRRTEAFEAYFFETKRTKPLKDLVNAVRHESHHGFSKQKASKEYLTACAEIREWILKHLGAFPEKLYYGWDEDGFDHVSKKLFLGADEEYGMQEYLGILLEDNYGDDIMNDIFPEGVGKHVAKHVKAGKKPAKKEKPGKKPRMYQWEFAVPVEVIGPSAKAWRGWLEEQLENIRFEKSIPEGVRITFGDIDPGEGDDY